MSRCRSSATVTGGIAHLGERECSVQRRFQKIVEIAPAPALDDGLRQQIIDAAVRFAKSVGYTQSRHVRVPGRCLGPTGVQPFVFIEANARLQVEHTVTEAGDRRRSGAERRSGWRRAQR